MFEYDENPAVEIKEHPTRTDTHFITHLQWNRSNEIGVRTITNGVVDADSFQLIQHGWHDFELAEKVVIRLLAKGRSIDRIRDLMDFMKDRRMIYPKPTFL